MKLVVFNNNHILDIDHEVLYIDIKANYGVSNIVEQIKEFKPDLIIEEEKNDGISIFTDIYKQLPHIPKAYWLIDGHCNLIDHVVYAKQFDYVFCAQSWFIPIIEREVIGKVFYLPLCHTQTLTEYENMLEKPVEKDIELSFVGNIRSFHVERKKYVGTLLEKYPDTFVARQTEYIPTLNYLRRSKRTFNCSLNNDLNFRVWEGIACGAMVITDRVTDIDNIHDLKRFIQPYDKLLPDLDLLKYEPSFDYEAAPKLAEKYIRSNHTMTHRINQLIEMTKKGVQYEY